MSNIKYSPQLNNLIVNNPDGTVSVYSQSGPSPTPVILTKTSCEALSPTYVFDLNTLQCIWGPAACNLTEPFKLVLNPNLNDGSFFSLNANDNCSLSIDFDYLFKIKCEDLYGIFISASTLSPVNAQIQQQISQLEILLSQQTTTCQNIANQIANVTAQINSTNYSITCSNNPFPVGRISSPTFTNNTGFGPRPAPFSYFFNSFLVGTTYCLTEPDGLQAWANILGPINYQNFLSGDSSSYSCADVQTLVSMNDAIVANNSTSSNQQPILLYQCSVPFGTKSTLVAQLNNLLLQQANCQTTTNNYTTTLNNLTIALDSTNVITCSNPVEVLELLDVSVSIDIVTSANTLQTVYQFPLFPAIGLDNLYNYLVANPNSGFYLCDGSAPCTPMSLTPVASNTANIRIRGGSCRSILNNILTDLFIESQLSGTTNGQAIFDNSLSPNVLASNWLHFNTVISNPLIISQLANQKIKLSIKVNHTCSNVCVLIDEITLDKVCVETQNNNIVLSQSPGFELDRVIDNKKSWIANSTPINRNFVINDINGVNGIRQTNYNLNDERLVINTKEIDLDLNIAAAIETDVWYYITNNPCLLTGTSSNIPCTGACGDNDTINFNNLMITPISAVTTVVDFDDYMLSEFIDAKDRQTLSAYPTLRALYDRYMNSSLYCSTASSAFNYATINQFASVFGNYWVDIIEQVIPATTIWGSVKIYSNTVFDQQKFKYKAYTSLFCQNPYAYQTISSPVNGNTGLCSNVSVTFSSVLPSSSPNIRLIHPTTPITTCNSICIAQMNAGSEFIGTVTIINSPNGGGGGPNGGPSSLTSQ